MPAKPKPAANALTIQMEPVDSPENGAEFAHRDPLAIEWWPIERPVRYARNARVIPPSAISKCAASLKEFGWRQPIVVDAKGVIIAGHVRLLAAQSLKLAQVPVHVASDLTKAQAAGYRLADNRTHDETAWDMQLVGLELADLAQFEFDLKLTGFDKAQAREALLSDWEEEEKETVAAGMKGLEFRVVVDCDSEEQQTELLDRFEGEGLKCRALIS
jgi:hypothetical protein